VDGAAVMLLVGSNYLQSCTELIAYEGVARKLFQWPKTTNALFNTIQPRNHCNWGRGGFPLPQNFLMSFPTSLTSHSGFRWGPGPLNQPVWPATPLASR